MPSVAAPPAPAPASAPAPAAPAAKPSAAAPKAGDKPPEIIAPPETEDPFKGAFDEIDQVAGEETDKENKRNKGEKAKAKEEKLATNGDAKPGETKPKEDEPKTNPELRAAYTALKEKVAKEYEPQAKELPALRAKVKELESRDESSTKAAQDELAALKKENAELHQHVRFSNYKQSKEYKELESTLNDAWSGAMRKLGGISISRTDAATGDVTERELTVDDLARYARLDPKLLWKELKSDIPDAAERTTVINHVQKIQDLSESVFKAEEKAKADSEAHAKSQTEAQRQSQDQRAKLWKQANAVLLEKYPKWLGKDETDLEGNEILDKGHALTDLLFDPASLTPERIAMLPERFKKAIESAKPFSPEDLTRLHAVIANKAANHDRLARRNKLKDARISELEASLKEYEESGPDAVQAGRRRRDPDAPLSAEDEFDAIARQA